MKLLFLLILVPLHTLCSYAQNLEVPQKEFTLSVSHAVVELSGGETRKEEIKILKSKGYQKSKVKMGLSSSLPQGISITFNPDNGNFDLTEAIITVLPDVKPGQYSVILNATMNNKTKASVLKITIP